MHLEGREGWELGLLGLREEGLDAQISESGGRVPSDPTSRVRSEGWLPRAPTPAPGADPWLLLSSQQSLPLPGRCFHLHW